MHTLTSPITYFGDVHTTYLNYDAVVEDHLVLVVPTTTSPTTTRRRRTCSTYHHNTHQVTCQRGAYQNSSYRPATASARRPTASTTYPDSPPRVRASSSLSIGMGGTTTSPHHVPATGMGEWVAMRWKITGSARDLPQPAFVVRRRRRRRFHRRESRTPYLSSHRSLPLTSLHYDAARSSTSLFYYTQRRTPAISDTTDSTTSFGSSAGSERIRLTGLNTSE